MDIRVRRAAVVAAFAILIAPVYGWTAHAAPAPQADRGVAQPAPAPAAGELIKVDPDAKTLIVKTASGEMLFHYDNQTVVSGGEKSVAGLATMSGAQLTVSYRVEGANNIATRIDVRQKG